jgi:adenosylcobinamide-phosphate synthase
MVFLVLTACFLCTAVLLYIMQRLSFGLYFLCSVVICTYMLALRSLREESTRVERELEAGDLPAARKALSWIVGRDTEELSEEAVARAAVETVAENASDGVIAPLLYMALFGPLGGVLYKAVNTMDSMVGYHNQRYEHWGRAAARLDDGCNFLPARISGLLLCAAAPLAGQDGGAAWRIFCRDRLNHKSPNSAHTEAACAGALGVQLGGPSRYFGQWVDKPTIGDSLRSVEAEDIRRANDLTAAGSFLALVLCCALNVLFDFLTKGGFAHG